METGTMIFAFFVIFFGASVLATAALYTKQSLLVAYMVLGAIVGPWGLKLIPNTATISDMSGVGIMFLLFLLGLNLQPKSLISMLRGATIITLASSIAFAVIAIVICRYFGFDWLDSVIVGASMMFSSTIIGLKLLPTTALHHQHIGDVVVSVLLMQDIIAIFVLLVLNFWGAGHGHVTIMSVMRTLIAVPSLVLIAYFVEKYVLFRLFRKFNRIKEYVFLLAIGWCLGMSELAHWLGVSLEIGAFIAGVSLASSPISQYIAESLKPLRDFFLIVFFFSVGAAFNFHLLPTVLWPVVVLTIVMLVAKPGVYWGLLSTFRENKSIALEVGARLGQASEFSLLVAFLAYESSLLTQRAYICIQAVTILTFIASSYLVVLKYPTPIAMENKLRRD